MCNEIEPALFITLRLMTDKIITVSELHRFTMNAAIDSLVAPKTLYVGNLAHQCTEDLIMVLFNQIGPVKVSSQVFKAS